MNTMEATYELTDQFYQDLYNTKGIVIEGGPRPREESAPKRRKQSKSAGASRSAAAEEADEVSDGSGDNMPRFTRTSMQAPSRLNKHAAFNPAGESLYISETGFRCKLCSKGWGLRTKTEENLLSEEEITWNKLINEPVKTLQTFSVPTYIDMVLEGYNTIVRPKEDCGDITRKEIESHIHFCVKDSGVEKMFQIEFAREKYMKYELLERQNIEQGIIDARAGDISLKYQQYAMKLLKEREKELKEATGG
jgi:hypothetical protein